MKKVVEQTKMLGNYFNNENRIKIVTNVGGFSMDKPLSEKERLARYEIFESSLNCIIDPDVEIIPQTMAPFPWQFRWAKISKYFSRCR